MGKARSLDELDQIGLEEELTAITQLYDQVRFQVACHVSKISSSGFYNVRRTHSQKGANIPPSCTAMETLFAAKRCPSSVCLTF